MAFDWQEYLQLALFLVKSSQQVSQEACLRSATNRAYYAAFCHARNHAQSRYRYIPLETGEDDRELRIHLERQGMSNIADRLDRLRQLRNHCDYQDEVFQLSDTADNAIKLALRVIENLK